MVKQRGIMGVAASADENPPDVTQAQMMLMDEIMYQSFKKQPTARQR